MGFIDCNKATLQSIKLSRCVLTTGKWSDIVDEVVYVTSIGELVLEKVNEEYVGDIRFQDLDPKLCDEWRYTGKLEMDENDERRFVERAGKSVYAWRGLPSEVEYE